MSTGASPPCSVRDSAVGPETLSKNCSIIFFSLSGETSFLKTVDTPILTLFVDCSRFHQLVCVADNSFNCQQVCFLLEALNPTSWLIGLLPTLAGNRVWMKGRGKTQPSAVWGIGWGIYFPYPLMLILTSRDLLLHSIQSKTIQDPIIQEQLITRNTTKNLVAGTSSAIMNSELARTASEQALAHHLFSLK